MPTPDLDAAAVPYELLRAQYLPVEGAPDWHSGSGEPWIAAVLEALLMANATRVAIEIGGFEGYTSAHLKRGLARLPWSTHLTVCEIDMSRAMHVQRVLDGVQTHITANRSPWTHHTVVCQDSLTWLPSLAPDSVDFAWIDGDHEAAHVRAEALALWPAMRPGGLMCFHDVYGVCDLRHVVYECGGYALNLPRLGPAGGLGIVQVPPRV